MLALLCNDDYKCCLSHVRETAEWSWYELRPAVVTRLMKTYTRCWDGMEWYVTTHHPRLSCCALAKPTNLTNLVLKSNAFLCLTLEHLIKKDQSLFPKFQPPDYCIWLRWLEAECEINGHGRRSSRLADLGANEYIQGLISCLSLSSWTAIGLFIISW